MHMATHAQSVARNIPVSEEAYALLTRLRLPRESFSDVIRRLAARAPLSGIAGARTVTKDEWAVVERAFAPQILVDRARRRLLLDRVRK
jgi:predicted CopG family antitoxin